MKRPINNPIPRFIPIPPFTFLSDNETAITLKIIMQKETQSFYVSQSCNIFAFPELKSVSVYMFSLSSLNFIVSTRLVCIVKSLEE